jgi:hypothetical protein
MNAQELSARLPLGRARAIADSAVREQFPELRVVGAIPQRDSSFIELMVASNERPPIVVSVDRKSSVESFGSAVTSALRAHVDKYT